MGFPIVSRGRDHYFQRVQTPSQYVVTFLESVGRRQDAEYYLRLFRELPKASFAVIATESDVLQRSPASVAESLRFLARMDLYPVLATGLLAGAGDSGLDQLQGALTEHGIPWASVAQGQRDWIDVARTAVATGASSIVDFGKTETTSRFAALSELLVGLGTRKLVVLRDRGGLGPRERGRISLTPTHHLIIGESGISVINLRADLSALEAGNYLDPVEARLLGDINQLHQASPQLLTSIASPLNLLRELFTIRGAGTLVKTGSSIMRLSGFDELDFERLCELLQTTFEKSLTPQFAQRETLNVYLEASYRGVAILQPGIVGAFLTKFAVNKKAQGEGIGRDLWEAVLRDHSAVYWRARTANPVSEWYQGECDGMHREGEWRVYWRGIPPTQIADTIRDALARPVDLVSIER